jgi:hypothetical protein
MVGWFIETPEMKIVFSKRWIDLFEKTTLNSQTARLWRIGRALAASRPVQPERRVRHSKNRPHSYQAVTGSIYAKTA